LHEMKLLSSSFTKYQLPVDLTTIPFFNPELIYI